MNLEQLIEQMQNQLANALQLRAEQQKAQEKSVHPDATNHQWNTVTKAVELAGAKVAFEVVERLCKNCAHAVLQIPAANYISKVIEHCPGAEPMINTVEQDAVNTVDDFAARYVEDAGTSHDESAWRNAQVAHVDSEPEQPYQAPVPTPVPAQPVQAPQQTTGPFEVRPIQAPQQTTGPFEVQPGHPAPSGVNPFAPPSGSLTPPLGATVGQPLRTNQ